MPSGGQKRGGHSKRRHRSQANKIPYLTRAQQQKLEEEANMAEDAPNVAGTTQPQPGPAGGPPADGDSAPQIIIQGDVDHDAIVKEIKALNDNVSETLKQMDTKSDNRFKKLSDSLAVWRKDMKDRLVKVEKTLEDRGKLIEKYGKTVDFCEKTAKEAAETTKNYKSKYDVLTNGLANMEAAQRRLEMKLLRNVNLLERQLREKNVRIQGVTQQEGESAREAMVRAFKVILPDISKEKMEYAYRIPPKKIVHALAPPAADGDKDKRPGIILARFVTKTWRNSVFFKAKTEKDKLTDIIVREDHTKLDLALWNLAKPQMADAYSRNKRSKFSQGKLYIDGNTVPIVGEDVLILT